MDEPEQEQQEQQQEQEQEQQEQQQEKEQEKEQKQEKKQEQELLSDDATDDDLEYELEFEEPVATEYTSREAVLRNYDVLSQQRKNEISENELYAVLNLNIPRYDQIDYLDLVDVLERVVDGGQSILADDSEVVDKEDHAKAVQPYVEKGIVSAEMLDLIIGVITRDRQRGISKAEGSAFLTTFLAVLLFPFLIPFALPTARQPKGFRGSMQSVLRHILRVLRTPFAYRKLVASRKRWFLLNYIIGSVSWILLVTLLVLMANNEGTDIGGQLFHYSLFEPAVPLLGVLLMAIFLGLTLGLNDKGDQRDLRYLLKDTPLEQIPITIDESDARDEENMLLQIDKNNAKASDVLLMLLRETAEERKERVIWQWRGAFVAWLIAVFFGSSGMWIRLALRYDAFGACLPGAPDECTDRDPQFRYIVLISLTFGIIIVGFWLNALKLSYFVFLDKVRLFRRLGACLQPESARVEGMVYLDTKYHNNVVAWASLRSFVLKFKQAEVRRVEAAIACILFVLVMMVIPVLYEQFKGFRSPINSNYVVVVGGSLVTILGLYMISSPLPMGVLLNQMQDSWCEHFFREKWRASQVKGFNPDGQMSKMQERTSLLVDALHAHLTSTLVYFRILGVELSQQNLIALAAPVVTAAVSTIGTFVSTAINSSE